jgi:hypothetical protein
METGMDTTTAAQKAKVTVATVRTWCRIGAVAAAKVAGRWVIEAASLAYRISLTAKERIVAFTTENMIAIGGNRWQRGDKDRVYLNNWAGFCGLETSSYNTGSIADATYQGEEISNSQAKKIIGCIEKVFFDAADGKLYVQWGYANPRMGREQVWDDIVTGIRAAIATL